MAYTTFKLISGDIDFNISAAIGREDVLTEIRTRQRIGDISRPHNENKDGD